MDSSSTRDCIEEQYYGCPGTGHDLANEDFERVEDSTHIVQRNARRRPLPYNYVSFLKDADSEFDRSSTEAILDQLYTGVLLNQGKKKYWVDRESNKNCFMIFARALDIAWSGVEEQWRWESVVETRGGPQVEIAILVNICWLEIKGTFRTIALSPGTLYEVVFVVKMEKIKEGWDRVPVTFRLTLPGGQKQNSEQILEDIQTDHWTDIMVGEFTMFPATVGELAFTLEEIREGHWKSGLVVKGVVLRPKVVGHM